MRVFTQNKSGIMLMTAAVAVLLLTYGAMLAGLADGTIDMFAVMGSDTADQYVFLRALFGGDYGFGEAHYGNANHFMDLAIIAPLWLAFGYVWGIYVFLLLIIGFSAAGWILLSTALFGKSPKRAAFVILVHSLPLLYMGWFGGDVFYTMILPAFRFLPFATTAYLLFLAVRYLQSGRRGFIIAFAAAVAIITLSNQSMLAWFCAPFFAAVFLIFYTSGKSAAKKRGGNKQKQARCKITMVAVIIGAIIGIILSSAISPGSRHFSDRIYSAPEFRHIIDTIGNLMEYAWLVAKGNPASAIVWLAFVIIAGWKFLMSLPSKSGAASMPIERRVVFLFVPLAMAATLAAVVATGLFPFWDLQEFFQKGGHGGKRYMEIQPLEEAKGIASRYLLPAIFLPLFFAWVLYAPPLRIHFISAALAITAMAAMPKAATLDFAKVNPFSHPFYACLNKAAKEHNAKGIMVSFAGTEVSVYPHIRWQSFIGLAATHFGEGLVRVERMHRTRIKKGSFDFVISNADSGKFSLGIPGREPRICDYNHIKPCVSLAHAPTILDGHAILGAFGEPQNIIHCPGNSAIYHYDPPIILHDIVTYKEVGERFDAEGWEMPNDSGIIAAPVVITTLVTTFATTSITIGN